MKAETEKYYFGAKCFSSIWGGLCLSITLLSMGCGGSQTLTGGPTPSPSPAGSTSVTVQISSTANGNFSLFVIPISSFGLVNRSGQSVPLISSPQAAEFSHLNGGGAPLVITTIPQDVYTSAVLSYSNAEFGTITSAAGAVSMNTFENSTGTHQAVVNLPTPITISGSAMVLKLDLQESSSATCTNCGNPAAAFTINPAFTLTALGAPSSATKFTGLFGRINSIDPNANSVNIAISNAPVFQPSGLNVTVAIDSSTSFQGVSGVAALTGGMFADLDVMVQADGSFKASRFEVSDPAALNVMTGPIITSSPIIPEIMEYAVREQGDELSPQPSIGYEFKLGSAVFRLSGEVSVPANLPFTPVFDANSIALGQYVTSSTGHIIFLGSAIPFSNTLTLMPQTVNGTVTAVSSVGGFTAYNVFLSPNDMITAVNGAKSIMVYVDASTENKATAPIVPGSVIRANGLLFNDGGTLRMPAHQLLDGVAP
jgi:hypothetical protein